MKVKQKGFTLVEIAIVLVIVGLLLGAVLKGQELIFNSKVKATFNMSRELSASMYSYQDRYKQLPGDDNGASNRFPTSAPRAANGNGDGLMGWGGYCAAGAFAGENCQALYHLRLAGFLTGKGADPLQSPAGGTAFPAPGNAMVTGASTAPVLALRNSTVTHKMMSAIDTSFDDGDPRTGSVRCQTLAAYNMATPEVSIPYNCILSQ